MGDSRRYAPALILALGALLLVDTRRHEAPRPRAPLASLPETLGAFRGSDVILGAEEQKLAGMSEYMLRQYTRDSSSTFSVYVGYYAYQLQGRTIHSPKNCLPGAGWQAVATGIESISVGDASYPVNRYLLTNGSERALVYYWYQGRGRIAASELGVKWDLLRDAALRGRSEEALVRIVIPLGRSPIGSESTSAQELAIADKLATETAASLIPMVTEVLPQWEFGGESRAASTDGGAGTH